MASWSTPRPCKQAQLSDTHKRTADGRINFAYYLNPNGQLARPDAVQANNNGTAGNTTTTTTTTGSSNSTRPFWPSHAFPGNHNSLRLDPANVTVIQDTFREDQMAMFDVPSVASTLFFKRSFQRVLS